VLDKMDFQFEKTFWWVQLSHSFYFSHKAHKTQINTCETSCKENEIEHMWNFEHTRGESHMPQHLQDEATGETDRSNFSISTVLNKSRLYLKKKWNLAAMTPKNLAVIKSKCPSTSPLWRLVTWMQVCANFNHPKVMKAEPSWLIPEKLAANLELLSVSFNVLKYDQELSKDRDYFRVLLQSHF